MAGNEGIIHALSSNAAAPALHGAAVTPSDSTAVVCRALYVGTSGNIKVTTGGGDVLTFNNVPVGILPVSCTLVWAATTATDIIALW